MLKKLLFSPSKYRFTFFNKRITPRSNGRKYNYISRGVKISPQATLGQNNRIEDGVIIHDGVTIGDHNRIGENTIVHPNTRIGNYNVILNDNILGEYGVERRDTDHFPGKKYNGLIIGNHNFFHVRNLVFNGHGQRTIIGNHNKILAENHIGHDTTITNGVVLYARCITGGYSVLLPHSTMGIYSAIQQRMVLGSYAMIAMGNCIPHNVFPFFMRTTDQYLRPNSMKIPDHFKIHDQDNQLREVIQLLQNTNNNWEDLEIQRLIQTLSQPIQQEIQTFYSHLSNRKNI